MSINEALHELHRMREISIALLELDLDNDQSLDRLAALQLEQEELRTRLSPYIVTLRVENQKLIQDCIELERKLSVKLIAARNIAQEQINKIQAGTRSKNIYAQNFYQTEGYFIDHKK